MHRVLIVEDEERIASFVSRGLTSEGFSVDTANDGIRGLEMARRGGYDLVVLDLLLPSLNGVSVLRSIMQDQPDQPVLVLSALSAVRAKVRCLELGATDYLAKPFELAELLARVRARMRQPAAGPADRVIQAGPITLDLTRRAADVGDGPIALTTREFHLLRYLMHKGGAVCTREELLAEIWGYSFDPGTNVVDVYVRRLRSKLRGDVIETVRSVGYRLVAT